MSFFSKKDNKIPKKQPSLQEKIIGAQQLFSKYKFEECLKTLEDCNSDYQRNKGFLGIDLIEFYDLLGNCYFEQSDYHNALIWFQEAYKLKLKKFASDDLAIITSYYYLGMTNRKLGIYKEALQFLEKGYKLAADNLTGNLLIFLKLSNEMGIFYTEQADPDLCLQYLEDSLEKNSGDNYEEDIIRATTYEYQCIAFRSKTNEEDGKLALDCAIKILQEYDHYHLVRANRLRGLILAAEKKYEAAKKKYLESLRLHKLYHGPDNPDSAKTHNGMGTIYLHQHQNDVALTYFETCIKIMEKYNMQTHPDTGRYYCNFGVLYQNKNNHDKALENYKKCIDIMKLSFGDCHPALAHMYMNVSTVYGKQAKKMEAMVYLSKCINIQEKIPKQSLIIYTKALLNQGLIHNMTMNLDAYLDFLIKARILKPNNLDFEWVDELIPQKLAERDMKKRNDVEL